MAAQNFRIDLAKAVSPNIAGQLLNTLETINQAFAQLLTIRAAMIQEKDGTSGTATDWVTVSNMFGFVDNTDAISSTVAMNAFTAIDTFNTSGGPSLQQCCAQFKQ